MFKKIGYINLINVNKKKCDRSKTNKFLILIQEKNINSIVKKERCYECN